MLGMLQQFKVGRGCRCEWAVMGGRESFERLAGALGMSANDIQGVKTAALLHDIGKLAVPEHILSKPGPLTQEEFQKIRIHPQVGAEIISGVPFPYPVSPLILSHHERWDGKGYPAGLKAEDIPLGARILSAVDYFDALMSERPYHKAMTSVAAFGMLQQESGKALDPRVVQTFIEMYPGLAAEADASQEPARKLTRVPSHAPAAAPAAKQIPDANAQGLAGLDVVVASLVRIGNEENARAGGRVLRKVHRMQRAGQQAAKLGFELGHTRGKRRITRTSARLRRRSRRGGFKAADRFRGARPV